MSQQDQQMLFEFLYAERHLAGLYHEGALYASTASVKTSQHHLLSESHQICTTLYDEMEKRQWLEPSEPVDPQKLAEKQKQGAKLLAQF